MTDKPKKKKIIQIKPFTFSLALGFPNFLNPYVFYILRGQVGDLL